MSQSQSWKFWKLASALCLLANLAASAAAADVDGMVDIGAGQLHAVQAGEGPYTVVFESGFASDLSVWRKVAPEVAGKSRVLVYSRAGAGKSPARAHALTIAQSSAELSELLAKRQIKPPYILVGHSYGGFLIRYFAANHPEQVAGMVFVDPADEGLETVLRAIDPARVRQDQQALRDSMPPQARGDLQMIQKLLDDGKLPAMPALPDVPTVLLTSVRARAGSEFYQETPEVVKIKRARHADFLTQFSSGAHVFTPNSGHNIQQQEPALVVAAIEQVRLAATQEAARRARQAAKNVLMGELEQVAALLGKQQREAAESRVATALAQSRFGEAEINTLGFDVMNKGGQPVLGELVLAYNAKAFPQSDNAADSYGEALLTARRPAEAGRQFERALALGKANGAGARALAAYQQNLDKAGLAIKQP